MSEFTVLATAEEVAEAAAAEIADVLRGGAQTLVLAGGTTPKRCYELLAELDVQWGRVTVLFGDERCVPPDHPDSNYRMVKESLLDRVTRLNSNSYLVPNACSDSEYHPDILRSLHSIGGQKVLSLELFNRKYWGMDAAGIARAGLDKMKAAVARAQGP